MHTSTRTCACILLNAHVTSRRVNSTQLNARVRDVTHAQYTVGRGEWHTRAERPRSAIRERAPSRTRTRTRLKYITRVKSKHAHSHSRLVSSRDVRRGAHFYECESSPKVQNSRVRPPEQSTRVGARENSILVSIPRSYVPNSSKR